MALGYRVAWGYGAGAAVLVVGLLVTTPAYSAPLPGGVSTSAVTPSPTPTPEPTPTPTPTPTATPTPTSTPTPTVDPDLLLPDVIALPASQLSVQSRSDGRRLRFTSALGNVGLGPLEVRPNKNRPCPPGQHNSTQIIFRDANHNATFNARHDTEFTRHRAGCMVFHPLHNHWHFKATARYTLLDASADNRVVVSTRRKVSFCLRDIARVPQRYGEWPYPVTYGSCSKRSPQGISVGWMDIYQSFLAGQFLRLPKNLADGRYCLETVVDPINQLAETRDDNNSSIRAFAIRKNRIVSRDRSICQ